MISFILGVILPAMFVLPLFRSKFVNDVGRLYLLQDVQCGMIPVGLAAVITGWISLTRAKGAQTKRLWMPVTGIVLGTLALAWMTLAIMSSIPGIGSSS